ncbi:MAG: poly-gamma-glutamate biosynthesis protein PgsC [Candidatus Marinimicrobia bacterium]|jgi:poly-gamma-glutamate biosynthesis protein PgsC/CapC|nr:poly-gamma-glutamate biosynthesis protein PgsC [Candidatus Neomarinimicrobiota bacterium]|tara:strand:+ start:2753 stop:3298 length:546 start_codon:yes stop_codon:yes gene_type:complete
MIDNPAIAIGLGMIISLILTESVGVTAGGLIVPGYIALNLHSPAMVLTTFGISLFTLAILNLLSRYIIIYGKRRLVFCLLLAFILGSIIREVPIHLKSIYDVETLSALLDISELNFIQYFIVQIGYLLSEFTNSELVYVGYLIPGLIASWMDKQGILNTSSIILIIASFINLILMVLAHYV